MKIILLTLLFSTIISISFGQKNLQAKNSIELLSEGYAAYEASNFQEAIDFLDKISINDTNFVDAQKQIAQAYIQLEQFEDAIEILEYLLNYESAYDNRATVYSTLGVAYMGLKKFDKSIEILNKGIAEYPKSQYLYYARAKTYEKNENFQEAFENYKLAVKADIGHHASHVQLGLYAVDEGNYAEALMSFMTCILIESNGSQAASIVAFMEEMSDGSYTPKPKGVKIATNGDDFEELNLLFVNKIALQSNYKTKFSIQTAYANQMHLISSTISYDRENEGFWNQTYVKLYKELFEAGMLDPMIVYSLQSVESKDTKKKVESKRGLVDKFLKEAKPIWLKNSQFQYVEFEGKMAHVFVMKQEGMRIYGLLNEDETSLIGTLYAYHEQGNIQLETELDEKGEKNGIFKKYDVFTRNLVEHSNFKNNIKEGEELTYYPSGELKQRLKYENGLLVDTVFNYYRGGQIEDVIVVDRDMRHGISINYYENGKISSTTDYVDGKAEGQYKSYHKNGQLQTELTLKNDKVEGVKKGYYPSGQLKFEENFTNDLLNGNYKNYHANGKLKEEGSYLNGNVVGENKDYYSNGLISSIAQYDENGKENGMIEKFDSEGKKYITYYFKKGNLEKMEVMDKSGAIIKTTTKSGKKFNYESYYPTRILYSEGVYLDGLAEGEWKYYDEYGVISKIEHYKAGEVQDSIVAYHPNGKIYYIAKYKDGKEDGVYLEYNIYGELHQEGRYASGEPVNDWYTYYPDGSLEEEYAFKNGVRHGYQNNYSVGGKLTSYDLYSNGIIISTVYLDTNGVERARFSQMNGDVELSNHTNSYTRFIGHFNSGEIDGATKWYDADKNLITEGLNINGDKEGTWKYYDNSKLTKTIDYMNGEIHGKLIEFHENGKKKRDSNYEYGSRQGTSTYYFENGNKESEFNYLDDLSHGKFTTFGFDGSIQQYRYYDHGVLISYSHLDKAGKEIEAIPVQKGEFSFVVYYQNGKKAVEQTRINGLINGNYLEFYSDGSKFVDANYYYGNYQGPYTSYYANGKKKFEANYLNDEFEGLVTNYYENGTVKETMEFHIGTLHGEHKTYSETGKLLKTYVYYDGEMVKSY